MGYSQADKQSSHARIVEIAARRFRVHGLRGIGVAEIMKEAGLTVGGFYKHFDSREALIREAMTQAFLDTTAWRAKARADLRRAVREYLAEPHRDNLETSCAITAFLNDADKTGDAPHALYTARLQQLLALITSLLPPENQPKAVAQARLICSACVGALAMSRAVDDPRLSRELLHTVADQLMALIPSRGAGDRA